MKKGDLNWENCFNTNFSRITTNLMTKIVKNEIFFSENSLKKSSCYTNFLRFTTIKFSGHFFLLNKIHGLAQIFYFFKEI